MPAEAAGGPASRRFASCCFVNGEDTSKLFVALAAAHPAGSTRRVSVGACACCVESDVNLMLIGRA